MPAGGQGGGGSAGGSAANSNYTRLYIADGYLNAEVKPGGTATMNVTVGNSDNVTVDLSPRVVLPRVEGRPVEPSWITIEDENTTLAPDEERQFTITVSVPDDAELGEYSARIAFTNQTVAYPGGPSRPVHAAGISVDVRMEPAVEILDGRYHFAQVKAGDSYTYRVTIANTANQSVPLNPRIRTHERVRSEEKTLQRSWFEIDAPSEIAAGATENVTVTVAPPANASLGEYDTEIDLGLIDPNRPDRSEYWQQVSLSLQVWDEPEEPYRTGFVVRENGTDVSLSLSAGDYRRTNTDDPVSFDVTFVSPNGTEIDAERVRIRNSGSVSLAGEDRRGTESQGSYTARSGGIEFTYELEDAEAGTWTVEITPENAIEFRYDIVQHENGTDDADSDDTDADDETDEDADESDS